MKKGIESVRVFYSYAHKDEGFCDSLNTHLTLLRRQRLIVSWTDRSIAPGQEWSKEIASNLEEADIILLLVSADFLASDFCWSVELKCAMDRHSQGTARVIPVILRPCDWKSAPFSILQALPTDGRPVTTWNNSDEAWLDVVHGIREAIAHSAERPGSIHK